jgi:polysaccharide biosynthesis transport protein
MQYGANSTSDPLQAQAGDYYQTSAVSGGQLDWFGLAQLRGLIWRQLWLFLGVVVAALVIGLVLTMLMTPMYRATSTVRVAMDGAQVVEGDDYLDPYIGSNDINRQLNTLADVAKSRSMALRVVDALNLGESADVLGATASQAAPAGMTAEAWAERRRQMAADSVRGGLSVTVPLESQVISLTYQDADAVNSARIANAYAESFVSQSVEQDINTNSYARTYLETQIIETRAKLQEAENNANGYARANRIIGQGAASSSSESGGSGSRPATITASSLADVNTAFSEARARRIAAEQRWRVASNRPAAQLPEVQASSNIQAMRTQRAQIATRLAELRQRYQDGYPEVRELTTQTAALDQQIEAASNEIKQSIRNDFEVAQRLEAALQGELDRLSNRTLDEQDRQVQYNLIDRDADAYRTQLAALLERYNQITAAANVRNDDLSVLDVARVPGGPSSPNLLLNMFIALILGLGLGSGLALVRELLDNRLRTPDDVERKLFIATIGKTPFIASGMDTAFDDTFSPLSESYASIRASLDCAMGWKDHATVQVTSSKAGEGKSTTAVALARKYAQIGKKTLLVDLDLRRPTIGKKFGQQRTEIGVVDVLYSRVSLQQALVPGTEANLDVLPVGTIPPNPADILASGLVRDFLEKYRAQYDMIVIDSSPILGIADAPLLARFVDGVLVVIEANDATVGSARAAIRRLHDAKATVVGAVLTKFKSLEAGEGYNYQYGYYTYGGEND